MPQIAELARTLPAEIISFVDLRRVNGWDAIDEDRAEILFRKAALVISTLSARVESLTKALAGWDKLHADMVAAGGDLSELPPGLVEEFAHVQAELMDQTLSLLSEHLS